MEIKRLCDTVTAVLALLCLSPLLLLVTLLLKAESPECPVLFRQQRVGLNGEIFTILKFRTMRPTAPRELPTQAFLDAEAYITPLGRVLRNTSIDELPQLINVIRGEMSIIGPRPLILSEEEIHTIRRKYGVYQLRPGLSGLAQVHGRDILSDECKALWDRCYVEKFGPKLDILIFFQSILAVVKRSGVIDNKREKEKTQMLRIHGNIKE